MPKRVSVYEGTTHLNPIPFGCRIGNMFFTGGVGARNPHTREISDTVEGQIEQMVTNLRNGLKTAGGTFENVGMVHLTVKDESVRKLFNETWVQMFPDENSRPARHTEITPEMETFISMEVIAVMD